MPYPTLTKERAIRFRKEGFSHSEILDYIHVSPATLSVWLKDVPLSPEQQIRLDRIKKQGMLRGARSRNLDRVKRSNSIIAKSSSEISALSDHQLLLIGSMLYWAEGSKESVAHPGSGVKFTNQDPRMIQVFLQFLLRICKVDRQDIKLEVYIHGSREADSKRARLYWESVTKISQDKIVVYLKHNEKVNNRQIEKRLYHGTARICVGSSSVLLRRIMGWVEGVVLNCGVV